MSRMNRCVTTVLCLAVVWATGFNDTAKAGQPSKEISSVITLVIPEIATDYVLIYKPQPDVYTGKDSKTYISGETYYKWQPNDHTFIKGPKGCWHCFGVTRPNDVLDDETYEAEGLSFHALAPAGDLEEAFLPETWVDQPKFSVAGSGEAPHAIKIGDSYKLISSSKGQASSMDLYNWKDNGKLQIKDGIRHPNILYWEGTYYLVRCNNRAVNIVTSTDFLNWTDPINIFEAPVESWQCESPTLIRYNNSFYLFWCLRDTSPSREKLLALYKDHAPWSYDYRTFVYVSETPTDFNNTKPIAQLKAHAPEILQDEKGNWFISSADYPRRGINLARLEWKSSKQ